MTHRAHGRVADALVRRSVSRREFLKFCTIVAGTLALPPSFVPRIAKAVEAAKKPTLVWLEYQDCAGCTESLLRAAHPTVAEIVLDVLSVDYHETIMAPAGSQAEKSYQDAIAVGGHLVVAEGSIPVGDQGVYCTIGGKTAQSILQEATQNAAAVIAVGNCATFGGIPAAAPNPTKARGVRDLVTNVPVLNLSGCPYNVDNLTATVVYYLTFGALPQMDDLGRPLFAYGVRIHDNCERRPHFDAGEFVQEWGDEGHQRGWCLYQMGCKGPQTYNNCPSQRWNGGVSWPVKAGHGCIGCSEPAFWDASPIYDTVQIVDRTPPAAYPATWEGEIPAVGPLESGVLGAAVGIGIGAAATAAAVKAARGREESDEAES
jgi:hydrogenase small subunit